MEPKMADNTAKILHTDKGEFQMKPRKLFIIYHWDGQMLCVRARTVTRILYVMKLV
jgi:hypothetical protein